MLLGYDNGLVRVWTVQNYSMITLKGLLVKYLINRSETPVARRTPHFHQGQSTSHGQTASRGFGFGLTISPIMLLYEFKAHATPLITCQSI